VHPGVNDTVLQRKLLLSTPSSCVADMPATESNKSTIQSTSDDVASRDHVNEDDTELFAREYELAQLHQTYELPEDTAEVYLIRSCCSARK
jgi:hypothetical protein